MTTSLLSQIKKAVVVDFETEPIENRPHYPPMPVGVAVRREKHSDYYTGVKMKEVVQSIFASDSPILFHNAIFDVAVAVEKLGCQMPAPERIHDTLWMLFLLDPYSVDYQLKSSCERLLGWTPEERDAVLEWLLEHQKELGMKLSKSPRSDNYAGKYICKAPQGIVAKYAIGDVERTWKLALHCAKELDRRASKQLRKGGPKQCLLDAYAREQNLLPVIWDMERQGVHVDTRALKNGIAVYTKATAQVEKWLLKKLRIKELNFDSNADLAEALINADLANREAMGLTPTGKLCTAKAALEAAISDEQVKAALRWRGAVSTCVNTFIIPWYEQAKNNNNVVYARWNSTRRDHSGDMAGARTGRLSSSPNLQNIPKAFKPLFSCWEPDLKKRKKLPKCPIKGLPDVPRVRSFFVAEPGSVLIDRDFSSQELRVLAHFEQDGIATAFIQNPELDLHQKVADDLGIPRSDAKSINFAILYGVGNGHLAELLNCTVDQAKEIKSRYFATYPSIKLLIDDIKAAAKENLPITTWGGRQYFCEPPKFIDGRMWDFSYKLLNYLIQGSSADITKQAMIYFHAKCKEAKLLASVHYELLASVPKGEVEKAMLVMKDIMSSSWLNVPLLSTGKLGKSWAEMKETK